MLRAGKCPPPRVRCFSCTGKGRTFTFNVSYTISQCYSYIALFALNMAIYTGVFHFMNHFKLNLNTYICMYVPTYIVSGMRKTSAFCENLTNHRKLLSNVIISSKLARRFCLQIFEVTEISNQHNNIEFV